MELIPCPFCGGDNVTVKQDEVFLSGTKLWYIKHEASHLKCVLTTAFGIWHSPIKFTTREKAIEAWNRRAT